VDTRCSTTGFVLWIGDMQLVWKSILQTGVALSMQLVWKSKLQTGVALSTTEFEYVAACDCAREIVWLRNLSNQVGQIQTKPTTTPAVYSLQIMFRAECGQGRGVRYSSDAIL
jgi:hypothetical protein